jgi:hypothetical protein
MLIVSLQRNLASLYRETFHDFRIPKADAKGLEEARNATQPKKLRLRYGSE